MYNPLIELWGTGIIFVAGGPLASPIQLPVNVPLVEGLGPEILKQPLKL